jgi:Uma2 family endonuclease
VAAVTIGRMGPAVGDRAARPLTADEVKRMVEHGALDDPDRVELLNVVLVEKVTNGGPHEAVKTRLLTWLAAGIAARRFEVRIECALVVPDGISLPEPDVMVLEVSTGVRLPTTAALVIEVADSSLRFDREVKAPMYAAAGVPEYWSVDVIGRDVRVFSDPGPQGYAAYRTVRADGTLRPASVDVEPLDLGILFAGLSR